MNRKDAGFTLIELMIAVAVVAILLGLGVPAWHSVVSATHSSSARELLYEATLAAGNHAMVAGNAAVLCASTDGVQCSGGSDWSHGWIAFSDTNRDRTRSNDERLLRVQGALPDGVHLRGTAGRSRLVFQPMGGTPGSNVTFTLCDKRGAAKASTVVMANNGRLRLSKPSQQAALDCVYGG